MITHVTVNVPIRSSPENTMKLMRLMYAFRDAVRASLPLIRNGMSTSEVKKIVKHIVGGRNL